MSSNPCIANADGLLTCVPLSQRLALRRGLTPMDCVERVAGRVVSVRRGVLHGTGNKAVVLNFCPWCGTNLRPAFDSLKEARDAWPRA